MSGIDAFGSTLARGDGATPTEVFTALARVTNISGPGRSRETYDVTAHDSPDGWREFIGGLKDAGEVSFDLNFNPAVHVPIADAEYAKATPTNWKLTFPEGSVWAFAAILTSDESSAPHDGKLEGSVTLKISGKPTFTAGV
jgi:predicted secreted protein